MMKNPAVLVTRREVSNKSARALAHAGVKSSALRAAIYATLNKVSPLDLSRLIVFFGV